MKKNEFLNDRKLKCHSCGKTLAVAYGTAKDIQVLRKEEVLKDDNLIAIKCERTHCHQINYLKSIENGKSEEYHAEREAV